jgi:hypothetical protein
MDRGDDGRVGVRGLLGAAESELETNRGLFEVDVGVTASGEGSCTVTWVSIGCSDLIVGCASVVESVVRSDAAVVDDFSASERLSTHLFDHENER